MQNNFELPIVILPGTSRWYESWAIVMHSGATVLLLVSALPWAGKIFLLLPVLISYRWSNNRFCKQSHPTSITQVYCNDIDEWWLTTADGNVHEAILLYPCFVHARLVILGFKTGSEFRQRRYVILTPETADPGSLRRLRVRLRLPSRAVPGKPSQGKP